jgi:hypothetical protein
MLGELGKRPTEKDDAITDEIYLAYGVGDAFRGIAGIPAKSMI